MYLLPIAVLVALAVVPHISCDPDPDIVVETSGGIVRGSVIKTRKGQNILSFYSIRYGEPPIGRNRFRAPIPVRPWKGIYNATEQGHACIQLNPEPSYIVSEDCLFLDVYTKQLTGLRPVIVFIHGGGFKFGAKSDASPDYLLDKDVVFVSINYRLSAFGFLTTGTKEASGNFGFKDQNLALRWIRDNIQSFGGNPNRVTICGHSAGSFSVSLHLVSPMSRRLFHRAIVMSGSAVSHIRSSTRKWSQKLLEETFCDSVNKSEAVDCLRDVPAETILKIGSTFVGVLVWYFDVEEESIGERFLIENPTTTLLEGRMSRVPLLSGVNLDEFFSQAYNLQQSSTDLDQLNQHFLQAAPILFAYAEYPNTLEISLELRSFYLNNEAISDSNINKLGELFSDSIIGHGVHQFVSLARRNTNVFYYRVDYKGRFSHEYKPDGSPLGVIHGDELQYIFVFKKIAPLLSVDDPENFMVERMTSWWSQFATTGNPNNYFDPWTRAVNWVPSTKNKLQTLYINETCKVSMAPNSDRYAFLDRLFPL